MHNDFATKNMYNNFEIFILKYYDLLIVLLMKHGFFCVEKKNMKKVKLNLEEKIYFYLWHECFLYIIFIS